MRGWKFWKLYQQKRKSSQFSEHKKYSKLFPTMYTQEPMITYCNNPKALSAFAPSQLMAATETRLIPCSAQRSPGNLFPCSPGQNFRLCSAFHLRALPPPPFSSLPLSPAHHCTGRPPFPAATGPQWISLIILCDKMQHNLNTEI